MVRGEHVTTVPPNLKQCAVALAFYVAPGLLGLFTPAIGINAAMVLAILFSLKTMESHQNGFQPYGSKGGDEGVLSGWDASRSKFFHFNAVFG